LFETVPVGLYRANGEGEILDANPALLSILGHADKKTLLRINLRNLHVNPADYERWRSLLDNEKVAVHYETEWRQLDGSNCWVETNARVVQSPSSGEVIWEGSVEDISQRKEAENEREHLILDLQDALSQIHTLGGLLPICASCKKIRDEEGRWNHIESYIQSHSEAEFTHSFCPDCVRTLYPEMASEILKGNRPE
jgi:PAS domain S-box-containing protein